MLASRFKFFRLPVEALKILNHLILLYKTAKSPSSSTSDYISPHCYCCRIDNHNIIPVYRQKVWTTLAKARDIPSFKFRGLFCHRTDDFYMQRIWQNGQRNLRIKGERKNWYPYMSESAKNLDCLSKQYSLFYFES